MSELEATETPMYEGHGDHWACIFPSEEEGILEHIQEAVQHSRLRGTFPSPCPDFSRLHCLEVTFADELATRLLLGESEGGCLLATGFPVALRGSTQRIEISRVRPWEARMEAVVEGTLVDGGMLGFFDTSYPAHPGERIEGEEVEVELAAFAYHVEPAPDQTIWIDREDTVRMMRSLSEDIDPSEVTDLSPIEVHTKGMASLIPRPSGNPDDLEFQGPVAAVEVMEAWDQIIYRLDVTVLRHDDPITIPIYVARHCLAKDYKPKVGDDVRGVIWMQGWRPLRDETKTLVHGE